jgi:hypothetical protein
MSQSGGMVEIPVQTEVTRVRAEQQGYVEPAGDTL